jgi:hypothetical protein
MYAYVLTRYGRPIKGTLAESKLDAWDLGYRAITKILGADWGSKFFKRLRQSQRSAAQFDFKILKVPVVPIVVTQRSR